MKAFVGLLIALTCLSLFAYSDHVNAQFAPRYCQFTNGTVVLADVCPIRTVDVTSSYGVGESRTSGLSATLSPLIAAQAMLLPQLNQNISKSIGGLFGQDVRTESESLQNTLSQADTTTQEGRVALVNNLREMGFGKEALELELLFEAQRQAEEDRESQQSSTNLQNELLRLQIENLSNGNNAGVVSSAQGSQEQESTPRAVESSYLGSVIEATGSSYQDGIITEAELGVISIAAASISPYFGQAFGVTRSFITQAAQEDTDPNLFASTEAQMRSTYSNLDLGQSLVMMDFVLREAVAAVRKSNEVGSSSSTSRGQDLITGLSSLNDLYERGLLNEEEFNAAKRRLLGL